MEFDWASFIETVMAGLIIFLVTTRIGLDQYFLKRRIETIDSEYIRKRLVEPTNALENALGLSKRNYLNASHMLGLLRLILKPIKIDALKKEIVKTEDSFIDFPFFTAPTLFLHYFFHPPDHTALWKWAELAERDFVDFHQYLTQTIPAEVWGAIAFGDMPTTTIKKNADQYIKQVIEDVNSKFSRVVNHVKLIGYLRELIILIEERQPQSLSALRGIHKLDSFKNLTRRIETDFEQLVETKTSDQGVSEEIPNTPTSYPAPMPSNHHTL